MPPVTESRRRFKSPYWDVPPTGYEEMTPAEYKGLQASGRIPHSVVNPSSQILQGTKYAHPDPLEAAKAAAAKITATILGSQTKGAPALTRQARRLYVGNIPFNITENELIEFFQSNMISNSDTTTQPPAGNCVLGCQINMDKNFAFVEFRSIEHATAAIALDGISCRGQSLKIRRPHDYQPGGKAGPGGGQLAGNAGPGGAGGEQHSGERPPYQQQNHQNNPSSIHHQHHHQSSGQQHHQQLLPQQTSRPMGAHSLPVTIQVPGMQGITPTSVPKVLTEVLCLMNMVDPEELRDDEEYEDIKEDIKDECSKYGVVRSIEIPRPCKVANESGQDSDDEDHDDLHGADDMNDNNNYNTNNRRSISNNKRKNRRNQQLENELEKPVPGLGKVFVEFDSPTEAQRAQLNLAGRRFSNRVVVTSYFDRHRYKNKEF